MEWFPSEISLPITQRARKVIPLARREARKFGAPDALSEHLLLAVVAEGGGVAAKVLKGLDVTGRTIRRVLKTGIAADRVHDEPVGRCIERAEGAALRLGHSTIGTEHFLIGMVDAGTCRACLLLKELVPRVEGIPDLLIKIMAAPRRP